jgi:hypothetical protein
MAYVQLCYAEKSIKVFVSLKPFCKHKKLTLFATLLPSFNEIEDAPF